MRLITWLGRVFAKASEHVECNANSAAKNLECSEALPERVHAWRRVHEFALPERGLVELQPVRSQCIRPF